MAEKLTQSMINALKSTNTRYTIWDAACRGLFIVVAPTGRKSYMYSYTDKNGGRHNKKIGDADLILLSHAREQGLNIVRALVVGVEDPLKKKQAILSTLTLRSLIDDHYTPWVKLHRKSGEKTLKMLKSTFADFLDRGVADITLMDLEGWRYQVNQNGKMVEFNCQKPKLVNYKTSSLNRKIAMLKALFNWAVKGDLISVNPIAKMEQLRETDSDDTTRYLSKDEFTQLMTAIDKREDRIRKDMQLNTRKYTTSKILKIRKGFFVDYFKPLILTSLNTGMRKGALFQLLQSDVVLADRYILLRKATAKGNKVQHIYMNDDLEKVLSEWLKQVGRLSKYLFPSPRDYAKPISNIDRQWRAILKEAKIKHFRFHDLRHDFASQLVMGGVDLYTVSELLGHSDVRITKRYSHLSPEHQKEALKKLEGRS